MCEVGWRGVGVGQSEQSVFLCVIFFLLSPHHFHPLSTARPPYPPPPHKPHTHTPHPHPMPPTLLHHHRGAPQGLLHTVREADEGGARRVSMTHAFVSLPAPAAGGGGGGGDGSDPPGEVLEACLVEVLHDEQPPRLVVKAGVSWETEQKKRAPRARSGAACPRVNPPPRVCPVTHTRTRTSPPPPQEHRFEFAIGAATIVEERHVERLVVPSDADGEVFVDPPASRIRVTPCAAGVLAETDKLVDECSTLRCARAAEAARGGRGAPSPSAAAAAQQWIDIVEAIAICDAQGVSVTLAAVAWWQHADLLTWLVDAAAKAAPSLGPWYRRAADDTAREGVAIEPSPPGHPHAPRGGDGSLLWRREALVEDWRDRCDVKAVAVVRELRDEAAIVAAMAAPFDPNLTKNPPLPEWEDASIAFSEGSVPTLAALGHERARVAGVPSRLLPRELVASGVWDEVEAEA